MRQIIALIFVISTVLPVFANEEGYASWYAGKFQGRQTASGEIFDTEKQTAAHKTLAFGTVVRVTNLENRKTTIVRINDRGPFVDGRIIDLSRAAAREIDMLNSGVARVQVEVIQTPLPPEFYQIQVASFRDHVNAKNTGTRLSASGYNVVYEIAPRGFLRVVLDKVPAKDIDSTKTLLGRMGFSNLIVREEQR